jgi:quercetin dioxygenase-like cupin family protein
VSAYEVKRIDEFDPLDFFAPNTTWRPIRRTLGITAFGMNAYTGDAGCQVIEPHTEGILRHEEVYVVLSGVARFTLGGDDFEAGPGTLVYLRDPDTERGAVALEDNTTVLAVGGPPGSAYKPATSKRLFAVAPRRNRSNLEEVMASIREELRHKPDHAGMLYEVACYEAVLGRRADALASLRRAAERDARTREWARANEDFASFRDDPEFIAILAERKNTDD